MRSERSPEPIRDLRVAASFACCSRLCLSLMRAASTASAFSLFLCCERASWHSTTIPVGRCVTRTAESVLLTCCPPAPEARRLVSAGPGADLEEDVALVVGVLGQEQLLQLRFERDEPLAAYFDLAFRVASHLGIVEQLLSFGDALLGVTVRVEQLDNGLELRMLTRKLAKLVQVAGRILGR